MASNIERDRDNKIDGPDANPDPITGAPGAHPVGTGVGAAGGGAAGAAAGAAIGAAMSGPAAPIGAVVGAVAGAVAGGLAGKGVAEAVNPTAEDAYWRENYKNQPYYQQGEAYEDYSPAYRYGWESRSRYENRNFEDVEPDLSSNWEKTKGQSKLSWERAKLATRDAWDRVENNFKSGSRDRGRDAR